MIANRLKIEQMIAHCRTVVKSKLDRKAHNGRSLRDLGMFGRSLLSEDSENTVKARMQTFGEGFNHQYSKEDGRDDMRAAEPRFSRKKRVASWPGLRYALGRGSVDEYGLAQAKMLHEDEEEDVSYDDDYEEDEEDEDMGIDEREDEDVGVYAN